MMYKDKYFTPSKIQPFSARTSLRAGESGLHLDWLETAPDACRKGNLSGQKLQDCKTWLTDMKADWVDDCNANAAQGFPCQKWADAAGQKVLTYFLLGHF